MQRWSSLRRWKDETVSFIMTEFHLKKKKKETDKTAVQVTRYLYMNGICGAFTHCICIVRFKFVDRD